MIAHAHEWCDVLRVLIPDRGKPPDVPAKGLPAEPCSPAIARREAHGVGLIAVVGTHHALPARMTAKPPARADADRIPCARGLVESAATL